jgi:hypothetical protein
MEDLKRKLFSTLMQLREQKNHRHLQTDERSVAAGLLVSAARPHISLKARMLGGQAETIMRLRGLVR